MARVVTVFVLAIIFIIKSCGTTLTDNQLRVYQGYKTVYYDPVTDLTLKTEIEDSGRLPFTRIGFRSLPCHCEGLSCGCCAGINITRIDFNQKACTNFTYDPYDFSIKFNVAMNDKNIYSNMISAKNPPPLCMAFPYIPVVDFCVRFYNVFMPGNNLHACVDFETRVVQSPVMALHFDCIRIGVDGVAWLKPEDNGGLDSQDVDNSSPLIAGPEVYDDVNFETESSLIMADDQTSNSSLSFEEEANIGQLKL